MKKLIKKFLLYPHYHPRWYTVISGVILILPPLIITALKTEFGEETESLFDKAPAWGKFAIIFGLGCLPFFLNIIFTNYRNSAVKKFEKESGQPSGKATSEILSSIDAVVGQKKDTYGEFARDYSPSESCPLIELVDPKLQIEKIVSQMQLTLTAILDDKSISVVLVKPVYNIRQDAERGRLEKIEHVSSSPQIQRPSDSVLSDKNSFFWFMANKSGEFGVIEDIAKLLAKENAPGNPTYSPSKDVKGDRGSIMGFALHHTFFNGHIYVLTVKSESPRFLRGNRKEEIWSLCKRYCDRIELEYSILTIKEKWDKND